MSESKDIQPFAAQVWLKAAAEYFESRPSNGEDQEHWASVYNAENARAIADLIERQSKIIEEMERALQPFSDSIFNDNGDVTFNYLAFDDDDLFRAYSVLKKLRTLTNKADSDE